MLICDKENIHWNNADQCACVAYLSLRSKSYSINKTLSRRVGLFGWSVLTIVHYFKHIVLARKKNEVNFWHKEKFFLPEVHY